MTSYPRPCMACNKPIERARRLRGLDICEVCDAPPASASLCPATSEVVIVKTGEKIPVPCLAKQFHDGDHFGRFGGMTLSWEPNPRPFVIKVTSDAWIPIAPQQPNAACVIKVNEKPKEDLWVTSSSSSILDDITAAAEKMRADHRRGPLPMTLEERRQYNRFGNMFARALGLPKMPFPIEDAGPHPKDSE